MVAALAKITLDDGWPESSKEQVTQVYVKKTMKSVCRNPL